MTRNKARRTALVTLLLWLLAPGNIEIRGAQERAPAPTPKVDTIAAQFDGFPRELASYYGSDRSHERVRSVLSWFARDRVRLEEVYRSELAAGRIPDCKPEERDNVLGFWLGVRYMAHHFAGVPTPRIPPLLPSDPDEIGFARYDGDNEILEIGPQFLSFGAGGPAGLRFAVAFNVGIHESAHSLQFMKRLESATTLSELGVYTAHTRLGLPVKRGDMRGAEAHRTGTRDFGVVLSHFRDGLAAGDVELAPDFLEAEYLGFVFGPWIADEAGPIEALAPTQHGDERDFTLQDIIVNAVSLRELENRPADDPGYDVEDAPIAVDYLTDLYCARQGISDRKLRDRIQVVFEWIHACVRGTERKGEFRTLGDDLQETRDFADRAGAYADFSGTRPPAAVVQARARFMRFLGALEEKMTAVFGTPARVSVPKGYA